MKNNVRMLRHAGLLFCMIHLFSTYECFAQVEKENIQTKKNELYDQTMEAIGEECPQIAQALIDKASKLGDDKLVSKLVDIWRDKFDPVSLFLNCPTSRVAFFHAESYATENREWDSVRRVLETVPDSIYEENPDLKKFYVASLLKWEKLLPGDVVISNKTVRTYRRFPGITNSIYNLSRTHKLVWDERFDLENRLLCVEEGSRSNQFVISHLADAEVLWSPSGQYASIITRGKRSVQIGTIRPTSLERDEWITLPSLAQELSIVNTKRLNAVIVVHDLFSKKLKDSVSHVNVRYTDMIWNDQSQLSVRMAWGYDAEIQERSLLLSVSPDGTVIVTENE
jgi:hypothetical protein